MVSLSYLYHRDNIFFIKYTHNAVIGSIIMLLFYNDYNFIMICCQTHNVVMMMKPLLVSDVSDMSNDNKHSYYYYYFFYSWKRFLCESGDALTRPAGGQEEDAGTKVV